MKSKKRPPDGEIRQSQVLSTYGPGSMVDLPEASVLIGGLNYWRFPPERNEILEERLTAKIYDRLKHHYPDLTTIKLFTPPDNSQDQLGVKTGIKAFLFPTWFVAQTDDTWESKTGKIYRTRPLIPYGQIYRGGYVDQNKKKCPVVPVRFVQACPNGHISDINWGAFVQHNSGCTNRKGSLWLDEGGASNDFADIFVRCQQCGARRPLSDATLPNSKALGKCEGKRPWLGIHDQEECIDPEKNKPYYSRLLVRSASNAYFAQSLSVISLPDSNQKLRDAVNQVYDSVLQVAQSLEMLQILRQTPLATSVLQGFSDDAVWEEVQRRRNGVKLADKSIKQVEIETLLSQPNEIGEDIPESNFYARNRSIENLNSKLSDRIDRIVLVHRLREVTAQIGFTRFEPNLADIDGELQLNVQTAALGRELNWFPAIENKGEGVFISFSPDAIHTWKELDAVRKRGVDLQRGFNTWIERKGLDPSKLLFPGMPYIMLHSLSHLLITAVSLECGYSASAIRERIYAGSSGYGILLYTGSSGSEGTLGGLVQVGKRIESLLESALELGKLCSNDPVCAQHKPADTHEERFLHGAACHGCLLIAETSCERNNEFLDRALVVDTVENAGSAFFPEHG
ncbi:MAG: DUF1998 domain-containing protein [Leptolyngbya sp. UWPOB_LEPTO1]|uniref:DUF1998 domain-containing protein n=1 Tax=Leptolyngbya sp. UWPOB_LEPTO1 TaxID=2815653 RepID=UPI001AD48D57|nr:DUF1998 domain-containing protein [Leptolyngbya sp. UWPOB_LEPTO1]MBN8563497.1 DUF1998 domain-containing protein [Leptolyngbya sp. UWPOB_LEPTO1]